MAVPVVGLLAGAAVGLTFADVPALDLLLACLLPYIVVSVFAVYRAGAESRVLLPGIAVAFAVGGAVLSVRAWHDAWRAPLRVAFEEETGRRGQHAVFGVVTGTLQSDAAVRDDRVNLSLAVHSWEIRAEGAMNRRYPAGPDRAFPMLGGVAISVGGELARAVASEWRRGRIVRLPVQLRRPSRHLNPGAMDEERALARRGVALVGSAKSGALVEVLARGSPWVELGGSARAFIRRAVARHVGRWSLRSSAIVTAILIGDRAGLSPEMVRTLQEAGTYHTIAISGGNIAILAAITLALFRWSGVLGRGAMLAAIASFLAYGELVESSASVTRAIASAVLYFAARSLDHRIEPVQAILVAAGLLVATDPLSIVDPGFLLSFCATTGIVAALSPGRVGDDGTAGRRDGRWQALAGQVVVLVVASFAAEVALLPVVATFFGRITLAGLALNVIAIPAMTVAQVAGMLVLPATMLSETVADGVGSIAAMAGFTLLESGRLVAWLPALSWRVARPSAFVVAIYYAAALASLYARRHRAAGPEGPDARRDWRGSTRWPNGVGQAAAMVAIGAVVWIALEPWTFAVSRGDGRLHVAFIDVGQGDAAFIRFPHGSTMLIDAGGSPSDDYDVGDRVVAPLLKHLGVRRLDTIVVTHGDRDHAGGAAAIVRQFAPFDVWEGVPVPPLPLLTELRHVARAGRARWTTVQQNDSFVVDDVQVVVQHPGQPDWDRQEVRNDDSVVVELRWHNVSIVLTGDIGREVEQAIGERFAPVRRRVVKVPHHGSLTSSSEAFVRSLRAQVAVVSVGRGNPFGHPAEVVLRRYAAAGASVFRTDQDGAVLVDTDGHRLDVRTEAGRQESWPGS